MTNKFKKLEDFRINFQLHAEGTEGNEGNEGNQGNEGNEGNEGTPKTYTQAELDALLQAETDRRITAAQKKWEKSTEYKLKEAEKLSKMSEEERNKAKIEELQAELIKRDKEVSLRENKISCITEMEKRNIPTQLVDFIVSDDADIMLENLNKFEKSLKKLVNDEVNKRISGTNPKAGITNTDTLTKEAFKKLSLAEQNELYKSDKDKYMSLIKQ